MQRGNRWKSRKFWVAVFAMVATIIVGMGYEINPAIWLPLFGAEGVVYVIIEGILDIKH